jgi:hypothetical protein
MRTCLISFVPVHPCQSANVRKNVLQGISQLESINIAETELDVGIDG